LKHISKTLIFIICIVFSLLVSFQPADSKEKKLKVTVSIAPQKYFVEKIGVELVDVSVMVPSGSSAATYEPKPRQMVNLGKSKAYFAIGVPFEKVWLKKFAGINSTMKIVYIQEGIEKIHMKDHHNHDQNVEGNSKGNKKHNHAEGDRNAEAIKDPHIWLSPKLVMKQALNILRGLINVDPNNEETYKSNYEKFVEELSDLDLRIRGVFSGKGEGTRFMVYHPSWGYFAESYGLKQIPIEIEGKEPTLRELKELIQKATEEGVTAIFVQPQFSSKSAETIAKAIGAEIIIADPLNQNWNANLLNVAEKFKTALK